MRKGDHRQPSTKWLTMVFDGWPSHFNFDHQIPSTTIILIMADYGQWPSFLNNSHWPSKMMATVMFDSQYNIFDGQPSTWGKVVSIVDCHYHFWYLMVIHSGQSHIIVSITILRWTITVKNMAHFLVQFWPYKIVDCQSC